MKKQEENIVVRITHADVVRKMRDHKTMKSIILGALLDAGTPFVFNLDGSYFLKHGVLEREDNDYTGDIVVTWRPGV